MTDQRGNVVPLGRSSRMPAAVPRNAERPSEEWLTAKILGMLSIYYQPEDDPDVIRLSLALWVDALSDLPQESIDRAIRKRLQSSSRQRPVPGEIRELALACLEEPARRDGPAPFGPPSPLTESERKRVIDALSDLSRQLGGVSLAKMHEGALERIMATAAQVCGVSLREIRSKRRTQDCVMPRFLGCLLCRDHTGASFPEIGKVVGGRDHTTVMHAVAEAEKRIASDPKWAEAHAEMERRLAEPAS